MSTTKVKGLLKGLRYISRVFDDNGKEQCMEIGFPTDVKHVAHIGWDGPTVDSPSWMKDFEASPGGGVQSGPLASTGGIEPGPMAAGSQSGPLTLHGNKESSPAVKWDSEDSSRRGSRPIDSSGKDLPDMPKSSRRGPSSELSGTGSPRKEKPRRRSKDSSEKDKTSRKSQTQQQEGSGGDSLLPPTNVTDAPKKSRRKKSKENIGEGSTRSSRRNKHNSQNTDVGADSESSVKSKHEDSDQTSTTSLKTEERMEKESSELL